MEAIWCLSNPHETQCNGTESLKMYNYNKPKSVAWLKLSKSKGESQVKSHQMISYTVNNLVSVKDILKTLPSNGINNYIKMQKDNWLYVIITSRMHFRVNLHFIVSWMSRKQGRYLKFKWQLRDLNPQPFSL